MPATISRAAYADMFGPTTGDRVRLADTDIIIEVEKDCSLRAQASALICSSSAAGRDALPLPGRPAAYVSTSLPAPRCGSNRDRPAR